MFFFICINEISFELKENNKTLRAIEQASEDYTTNLKELNQSIVAHSGEAKEVKKDIKHIEQNANLALEFACINRLDIAELKRLIEEEKEKEMESK